MASHESSTRAFPVLLLFVLIAAALRLYGLDRQSYWIDEHVSLFLAKDGLFSGFPQLRSDVHPPLYFTFLHYWVLAFGHSEVSVRLLSVIPSVATVAVVGRLGKALYGTRAASIAAFFAATSLVQIYYAQEARSYAWMMFFTVLSFDALLRWKRGGRGTQLGLYVIFTTALLYTHYFGLFIVASQALYVLFMVLAGERSRRWLGWMCGVGVVLVLASLWLPIFTDQFQAVRQGFWIPKPTPIAPIRTLTLFLSWWGAWSGGSGEALYAARGPATAAAWVAVALGAAVLARKFEPANKDTLPGREATLMVFFWLVIPMSLGLQLSALDIDVFTYRNTLVSAPALFLLAAAGCARLQKPLVRSLLIATIAAPSIAQMPAYYATPHKDQWREAAFYTANAFRPSDAFVFDAPFVNRVFEFYSPLSEIQEVPLGTSNPPEAPRIWLVRAYAGPVSKSPAIVAGWGYREAGRWEGTRIEILLFEQEVPPGGPRP